MSTNIIKRTSFSEKVYELCKKIPKGKVSTYAEIAKVLGNKMSARAVGNALNKNRSKEVPCHRVVRSDLTIGGYAFGSINKIKILELEGIRIKKAEYAKGAKNSEENGNYKIDGLEFLHKFN